MINEPENFFDSNTRVVKITTSDSAGSDWGCGTPATIEIYDMDDLGTNLACDATIVATDISPVATCAGVASNAPDILEAVVQLDTDAGGLPCTPVPITISSGASKAYKVKLDTTGASTANDDSVRVDLVSSDTAAAAGCAGGAQTCLEWTDGSAINIQNGFKVENLPVNGRGTSF